MSAAVIVSHKHKKLLVNTPMAHRWYTGAPTLNHNGGTYVILDHAPDRMIELKKLGVTAPAPILSYYDWPGGKKPFEVQLRTCTMLTTNPRAYVLNDMGTGKTKITLWSWDYLNKTGAAGKLLVVAPLSTLYFTWAAEVMATLPGRRAVVLHGTKEKRLKLLEAEADIYIINHDGLKVIADELLARTDINTLALDELAVYRNRSSRSTLMRSFAKRFKWAWGLTGRPMPNAPTDVWQQCQILTPETPPKYFREAQSILMFNCGQYRWEPKPNAIDTAYRWMQPSVRYTLDDVVELPPAVYRTIDVELSKQQTEVYRRVKSEMAAMVKEKVITAANAGVAMGKLLQIAGGWVYTTHPEYATLDAESRIATLIELVDQAANKVIVFAPYRHHLTGLSAYFDKAKIEHAVVHGDTPKREEIFNLFQNTNKHRVLLGHPKCMHHGITLTAADTIIWWLPTASLDMYEQANARIRRYGQTRKQQFLHLQGTAVERHLYTLLTTKQQLQDQFLRLLEESTDD